MTTEALSCLAVPEKEHGKQGGWGQGRAGAWFREGGGGGSARWGGWEVNESDRKDARVLCACLQTPPVKCAKFPDARTNQERHCAMQDTPENESASPVIEKQCPAPRNNGRSRTPPVKCANFPTGGPIRERRCATQDVPKMEGVALSTQQSPAPLQTMRGGWEIVNE